MQSSHTFLMVKKRRPSRRGVRFLAVILMLALLMSAAAACSNPGSLQESPGSSDIQATATGSGRAESLAEAAVASPVAEDGRKSPSATPASFPSETAADSLESTPTAAIIGKETAEQLIAAPVWLPVEELPAAFTQLLPSDEQSASAQRLEMADPPLRDEIELARLYRGWLGALPEPPTAPPTLEIGVKQDLTILNTDLNKHSTIQVDLLARGEHAYFWFDTGPGTTIPSPAELENIAGKFDEIYEMSTALFGSEANPGIDGDSRLHIVNVSPMSMCDVNKDDATKCRTAGYFDHSNTIPTEIDPNSNAREMFVMNSDYIGREFYFNVLAHELRHMIEHNQDQGEIDWFAEGGAMLAEDLLGYPDVGLRRGNIFLANPDQQLNSWSDENTQPHYGQGYLISRYIYDRLGPEFYFRLSSAPETGLRGIDSAVREIGLDVTGEDIWLDWLAALAIHDQPKVPEPYRLDIEGLEVVTMTSVVDLPARFEESVHQLAADYYRFMGQGDLHLDFQGSTLVPVTGSPAASGSHTWLSGRANFRHTHLSRSIDLTEVAQATLRYKVLYDIEAGYDFAYVFISVDGGSTWEPLVSRNMNGLDPVDDPSASALAPRFYTGQSGGWLEEEIDLTPYVGQEIMIRFAYITDQILTGAGIAFDDIAVPEINFYDDGESLDQGWQSFGFQRVTSAVPQRWQLQLVTFPEEGPEVELFLLPLDGSLRLTIADGDSAGGVILIVSASAPQTLLPGQYRLSLSS